MSTANSQKGKPKELMYGELLKLNSAEGAMQTKTRRCHFIPIRLTKRKKKKKINKKFSKSDDSMCWPEHEEIEVLMTYLKILDACSSSKEQAQSI